MNKEQKNLEKQNLQDEKLIKRAIKEIKKRKKLEAERLKQLEEERLKEIASLEAREEEQVSNELIEANGKSIEAIEKQIDKRVNWSGWKGYRDTRYFCPTCKKAVKNDDEYCHRCGQKLMFPTVTFSKYVEGQPQETIITWKDE